MTEPKLCRDCKYYQGNWDISDKCMHPDAVYTSEVDGVSSQEPCYWMRVYEYKCGSDAKWFEQYQGNRDFDDFVGFICAVAVTLLFVAFATYGPYYISEMMK